MATPPQWPVVTQSEQKTRPFLQFADILSTNDVLIHEVTLIVLFTHLTALQGKKKVGPEEMYASWFNQTVKAT